MAASKTHSQVHGLGVALKNEPLTGLAAQLWSLRSAPALVKRKDGKYEGGILGFVKGLRLSAGVIYYLKQKLSQTNLEVSWGHLLDHKEASCSAECDVIVHSKGSVQKWNGTDHPIMEFKFVGIAQARAVISCKSQLTSIDKKYPEALKKFGVKKVFLFAECCKATRFPKLRDAAKKAGYADVCCLYLTDPTGGFVEVDERMYVDFGNKVLDAVK